MGKSSKIDIEHIAQLANLNLSKSEKLRLQKELSRVIDYFKHLAEIDTLKITPTSQTTELENVYSDDDLDPFSILEHVEVINSSENVLKGFFSVPQILKERTDK